MGNRSGPKGRGRDWCLLRAAGRAWTWKAEPPRHGGSRLGRGRSRWVQALVQIQSLIGFVGLVMKAFIVDDVL